eukprot:scaffold353832_cov192-Cyclotella_meneghiniana.AAC.1
MHRYGTDEEIGRVLSRHGFDKALQEMGIDAKNPPNIRAVRKQRYEEQFQGMVARAGRRLVG